MTPSELKSLFIDIATNDDDLQHTIEGRVSFFGSKDEFIQAQMSQGDSPVLVFGGVNSRFKSEDDNVVNQLFTNYVDLLAKVPTSVAFGSIDDAYDLCDRVAKNVMKALLDKFEDGTIADFDPNQSRLEETSSNDWIGYRLYYEIKDTAFIN
jgi:hypothetical protein